MTPRPRVSLDANIWIRGVTFPRFPYEVLRHAARGDIIALVSPLVLGSVRWYIQNKFPKYEPAVQVLLQLMEPEVVPDPTAEQVAAHAGLVRDPKDVPVALAALQARADYLVSTDRDLTDVDDSTAELRRRLTPMPVGAFLHEDMGWSHEALEQVARRRWSDVERPFWEGE